MNQIKLWLLLSLLVKLVVSLIVPLAYDEYYYFLWGQNLSLSYFDHPPFIGWLLSLAQSTGFSSPALLRWPAIALGHGTLMIWLHLFKKECTDISKQKLFFWVAVLNPLWGLGNLIATPDIPLLFFWSLAILLTKRLLERTSTLSFLLLGICLGLGFLSKYQIVLFIPCLLVLLTLERKWALAVQPKSLITILSGFLVCLPVLIWNAQHDWASFAFQSQHGFSSQNWKWYHPFDYLGVQALLILPPFLWVLLKSRDRARQHWLFAFIAVPFLFFLISSLRAKVEANWVIMAYPALYTASLLLAQESDLPWLRKGAGLWGVLVCLVIGSLILQPAILQKTRLYEAKPLLEAAKRIPSELPHPLYAFNYQSASVLSYVRKTLVCKRPGVSRRDHFDYLEACQNKTGEFYILLENHMEPQEMSGLEDYEVVERQTLTGKFDLAKLRP